MDVEKSRRAPQTNEQTNEQTRLITIPPGEGKQKTQREKSEEKTV